jgi:hypothetical protein
VAGSGYRIGAVSEALGVDADGLPLFPPLPGGRAVPPTSARTLARLIVGLRTAVLTVHTEDVTAMVVFADHQPVDGVAVRGDHRVVGPDALDEVADAPVESAAVTEIPPELARVVGSYFLPTELRGVPAGFVAPDDFVRSLARPGQRGCLLVQAGDTVGIVFLARGRVVLAYRQDGPAGGFEQVAPLFAQPGATLWARLGPDLDTDAGVEPDAQPQPEGAWEPAPPPAPAPPPPAPPSPAPPLRSYPSPPEPSPVAPAPRVTVAPPPPAPAYPEPPPPPLEPAAAPLDVALAEVRDVLGTHAVRVEGLFRRAEPTAAGLRAAAESLRRRRVRLLSEATMALVADRVLAALEGARE